MKIFFPISDGSILNCLESLSQGSTPTNAGKRKNLSLASYEESTSESVPFCVLAFNMYNF